MGGSVAAAVCVHCVSFCEAAVENYATIVQLQMQNNQIKRAGQEAGSGGEEQGEQASRGGCVPVCVAVSASVCVCVCLCLPDSVCPCVFALSLSFVVAWLFKSGHNSA